MDDLNKKIAYVEADKAQTGRYWVIIQRYGTYEPWSVRALEKSSGSYNVVYRTDGATEPKEEAPVMTVAEYAANLYERRELP